jgi:hypothetical protein
MGKEFQDPRSPSTSPTSTSISSKLSQNASPHSQQQSSPIPQMNGILHNPNSPISTSPIPTSVSLISTTTSTSLEHSPTALTIPNEEESNQNLNSRVTPEISKLIDKDIDRTFINHPAFHLSPMLQRLRRVLHAFACYRPDIGYCQSLNFVTGYLLLFYDEEDAFWILTAVVEKIAPRDYFCGDMMGIHADLHVLSILIDQFLPKLSQHLKNYGVDIRPIAFAWFISLFIKTLPIESVLRVWDLLLIEGSVILFRVTLGILSVHAPALLQLNDFSKLFHALSKIGEITFDCDALMKTSVKMDKVTSTVIENLRKEARMAVQAEYDDLHGKPSPTSAKI